MLTTRLRCGSVSTRYRVCVLVRTGPSLAAAVRRHSVPDGRHSGVPVAAEVCCRRDVIATRTVLICIGIWRLTTSIIRVSAFASWVAFEQEAGSRTGSGSRSGSGSDGGGQAGWVNTFRNAEHNREPTWLKSVNCDLMSKTSDRMV